VYVLCVRAQGIGCAAIPGNLTRVQTPSHIIFIPWINPRITFNRANPKPQKSSSESSLLEEQMRARHPSYKKYATPRRVQRSTGSINQGIASWYVPELSGAFDLRVTIWPRVQTRAFSRGLEVLLLFVMANREDHSFTVVCATNPSTFPLAKHNLDAGAISASPRPRPALPTPLPRQQP
jgi:hypothetical protein